MSIICLFDIDGTLLHTGGAGQSAMQIAFEKEFRCNPKEVSIPVAGRTDRAITKDFFDHFNIPWAEKVFREFLLLYLEELPEQLERKQGQVLPGVFELLEQLQEDPRCTLGLLTGNFEQAAETKLKYYELDRFFQFGGFGDQHEHRNGVAQLAIQSAKKHVSREILPHNVWVLGDTPADVECARAIDANAIAVSTGYFTREQLELMTPDHLFDDFSNTNEVLQSILS